MPRQRRAAWLLVCVLPYLFLALMGEGLHTHNPFQPAGARAANALSATHAIQAGFEATTSVQSEHDTNCLACQWSASSTSVLPTLHAQLSPSLDTALIAAPATELWTSRDTASALGRGPPSV